jgi:hypothetical protein
VYLSPKKWKQSFISLSGFCIAEQIELELCLKTNKNQQGIKNLCVKILFLNNYPIWQKIMI